jgi:hypothetical protein
MNASEWIALAALIITVGGIVWNSGRTAAQNEATRAKAKEWADGIGKLTRSTDSKQERRWKHLVAMLVETAETEVQRERISKLLREDAWRD